VYPVVLPDPTIDDTFLIWSLFKQTGHWITAVLR